MGEGRDGGEALGDAHALEMKKNSIQQSGRKWLGS